MEETEHGDVDSAEQSVQDAILQLLDADSALDETARELVLGALADVVEESDDDAGTDWSPTYLTNITVSGFRGIGSTANSTRTPPRA